MMTTEQEASEKLCCAGIAPTCVGERCMAWRWKCWKNENGNVFYYDPNNEPVDGPLYEVVEVERIGYCGRAGNPFSQEG